VLHNPLLETDERVLFGGLDSPDTSVALPDFSKKVTNADCTAGGKSFMADARAGANMDCKTFCRHEKASHSLDDGSVDDLPEDVVK
jgi:hypothetical protein